MARRPPPAQGPPVVKHAPPGSIRAPVELMAVAVGNQVILAWTERGGDGLGFRIERATGSDPDRPFVDIGGVGAHVGAFRDESVKPRTTYAYRVHAWNATGVTSPSNEAEVTTP